MGIWNRSMRRGPDRCPPGPGRSDTVGFGAVDDDVEPVLAALLCLDPLVLLQPHCASSLWRPFTSTRRCSPVCRVPGVQVVADAGGLPVVDLEARRSSSRRRSRSRQLAVGVVAELVDAGAAGDGDPADEARCCALTSPMSVEAPGAPLVCGERSLSSLRTSMGRSAMASSKRYSSVELLRAFSIHACVRRASPSTSCADRLAPAAAPPCAWPAGGGRAGGAGSRVRGASGSSGTPRRPERPAGGDRMSSGALRVDRRWPRRATVCRRRRGQRCTTVRMTCR